VWFNKKLAKIFSEVRGVCSRTPHMIMDAAGSSWQGITAQPDQGILISFEQRRVFFQDDSLRIQKHEAGLLLLYQRMEDRWMDSSQRMEHRCMISYHIYQRMEGGRMDSSGSLLFSCCIPRGRKDRRQSRAK